MLRQMLGKSPEVIAQKHAKVNAKKKAAEVNPKNRVKVNAKKKLLR
jgi:hypothetical protein